MFYLKSKIYSYLNKGNSRSVAIKKNIVGSMILKCISILISLQVVPLTINYVNPTQYGIWLTLSSIIAWLSYFDLGFAHGFRNRFAEAKAIGNIRLAKEYVSTTYVVLLLIFSFVFILAILINQYLDWGSILNIDKYYNKELQLVFGILACFFCLNIVASVFTTMLTADQKPALASLIQTSGQLLAFVSIWFLTKMTEGNLTNLAFAFSGIPCFWLILISIIMFFTKGFSEVAPSFSYVRLGLIKKIIGLGGQFFIIMISMLFIFQLINIILSRIEGPESVTQYNIAYKYFNVLNMMATIILNPFWSAFTDAYMKKDIEWMKTSQIKLEKMWLFVCVPLGVIMLLISQFIYHLWIGDRVFIPFKMSVVILIYVLAQISVGIYIYLINGTGKVRIQSIIYVLFALIAFPTMSFLCKFLSVEGLLFIPIIVCICQSIFGRIQLRKIINNTAKGIWNK